MLSVIAASFGVTLFACFIQWATRGILKDWLPCQKATWLGFVVTIVLGAMALWDYPEWIPGWVWSALVWAIMQDITNKSGPS